MDDRYYVKIVPHRGDTIHRFVVRKRHVLVALASAACLLAIIVFSALHLQRSIIDGRHLREEKAALAHLATQSVKLNRELEQVQRENAHITQLIGAPTASPKPKAAKISKVSLATPTVTLAAMEYRFGALTSASEASLTRAVKLRTLALRVLNLRHIHALERAEVLAAIPSIDPVAGAEVIGCFCYRSYPDTEFHEGVDLAANYGDPVHAAAAGVVASAGWDGGYGLKIDIDHGNGYHTWYAHLSHIEVAVGQHVYKDQVIAAVGDTGFATGPHLHYQVMYEGRPIDPTPFLHGVPSSVVASLP
jgi:murein DD-endopeptidase MepM/ murein hydrolase activator NlpD